MRALLIYPVFPPTFWSYNKSLELVNRKVLLPPLGLITVAGILPQSWEFKLVDRNIRPVSEAEWKWAEIVILSGKEIAKQVRDGNITIDPFVETNVNPNSYNYRLLHMVLTQSVYQFFDDHLQQSG